MPKKRLQINKGLPDRWCWRRGKLYYQVPKGLESHWEGKKLFPLGKNASDAFTVWAERLKKVDDPKTIGQLLDRYALEVIPKKAAKTRKDYGEYVIRLKAVFGSMLIGTIEPQDIYKYVDERAAKVAAKREISLLRHAYTKAVRWGIIKKHPFKGEIRFDDEKETETPRTRYVEDWELDEALSLKPSRKGNEATLQCQAYIGIKKITGMSKGDLLRIQPARDFKEDGIHIQRHKVRKKTNKQTIYEWTDELRSAVDYALSVRPVDISPFLFCHKRGTGYFNEETGRCDGWNSNWHRFMDRLIKETKLKERFTDHDIRAKASSDAADDEQARKLMSHSSVKMTRRVYRRKPEKVKPLK